MATLRDVALRAGVSIGSASAVVNGTAAVSAAMREKVLRAVEELGYAPDGVARSLRLGRTRTIGLVLPDITNPHFAGMASAIEVNCDAAGYTLMLCNTADDPAKEIRHLRLMRTQRVDGIVLVPGGATIEAEPLRQAIAAPTVLVDRAIDGFDCDAVLLDNRAASRMVVEYLIRSGHRRIGIIVGPAALSITDERLAGYRETLAENGLSFEESLVVAGEFQPEPAYRAAVSLLHRRPRPTAIFSTSNHTTIGTMKALADQGFRCPQDISVAGIDDFDWSNAFSPRLTTAAQPIAEIGRRAVETLLERMRGTAASSRRRIVLAPRLIVRDSCRTIG
jgi:LacI family transcriptional regulator